MPHTNKPIEVGGEILSAHSIFNIAYNLPEMARAACSMNLGTGTKKGAMLGLKVGTLMSDRPNEGRFKAVLYFGEDHIKSAEDTEFVKEMLKCKYGFFNDLNHLYNLLNYHTPSALAKMRVYALRANIPFGRVYVNDNMIVFPFSVSDAYEINDTKENKAEFKSFLDKVFTPVDDIDYGESPYT